MPRSIRFHLDENCDPRIATGLRLHGVDVSTSAEVGLLHAADEQQFAYAVAHRRVVVTQDTDFLRIAAFGTETSGIVFYSGEVCSIGSVIRGLILIWEVLDVDEMKNRVEYLERGR